MELFNKFENCYYELFTKLMYEPPKTKQEIKKYVADNMPINKYDMKIIDQLFIEDEEDCIVFKYDKESKKFFPPILENDMPIILNNIELEALKNLIDMDIVSGFLKAETIKKLEDKLRNKEKGWSIGDVDFKKQYNDGDKNDIDDINPKIKIILQALKRGCAIKCDNILEDRAFKNQVVYPLKLEYSSINDKYRLHAYMLNGSFKKYNKMRLSTMRNLELLEDKLKDSYEIENKQLSDFNKKNEKVIELYVDPEEHVIERCFRLFSFCNRESIYKQDENIYVLKIYYYSFDETEIVKNILSLGSRVVVKSPESVRNKIIARVKSALSNYDDK